MANPEDLAILNQGVEAWNKWREENPDAKPDLQRADLRVAILEHANVTGLDLRRPRWTSPAS